MPLMLFSAIMGSIMVFTVMFLALATRDNQYRIAYTQWGILGIILLIICTCWIIGAVQHTKTTVLYVKIQELQADGYAKQYVAYKHPYKNETITQCVNDIFQVKITPNDVVKVTTTNPLSKGIRLCTSPKYELIGKSHKLYEETQKKLKTKN